jgi:hypothetical protein
MTYVIENNIPLPQTKGKPAREETIIFRQLQVGQSFVLPPKQEYPRRLLNCLYNEARRSNKKLTIRSLEDGSIRIWRTQ